ncbi:lysophospholipid acyltransferase family protein [Bowmanella sp. Y26]|uniref:lysophospholipid acyltransferase family protein n=1 Tax=Bowmanella yangjiangensis TaxID=2811230 RepID=UPI001BDCDFE9|nr:lysophospholipid acyltransferase family protein [Bowmanella yangjiangensis]MBT1062544.1 lysophospholipid acyltransferase family protein [Bowmanella yangjiangensis]
MRDGRISIQQHSVVVLLRFLTCLPRRTRPYLAGGLARLILAVARRTRTRAAGNVNKALPNLSSEQVKRLCFRSYATIIRGLLDCLDLNNLEIEIYCDESVRQQLSGGRGLCVATLHTCCYELVPLALQRLTGRSVTLTHMPAFIPSAHNPYQQAGINYVEKKQDGAFVRLLQHIQQGAVVSLHADLFARDVNVNFFGHQTTAPAGPAMLSAFAGTPMLLAYGCIGENGRYQVYIESFMTEPVARTKHAYTEAMQLLYDRFERIILRYPEQWYWSFNRWRT